MALLLLLAAVWVGLTLATRLATPIGELMLASRRISSGDLTARVSGSPEVDELDMLGKAFNNMTHQLQVQRDDRKASRPLWKLEPPELAIWRNIIVNKDCLLCGAGAK